MSNDELYFYSIWTRDIFHGKLNYEPLTLFATANFPITQNLVLTNPYPLTNTFAVKGKLGCIQQPKALKASIYNWEFQKKWLRAVQFSKGGSLEPFKRVTSWIFTENNPEDECVATDGDEHGDTEEHGPHPLHQTPAHVPGVPPRGVRALRLHVVIARIQPATKYLKELI